MEPEVVSLHEAKAQLSELTERAARGIDIVIAKRGRLVARLTAARRPRKRVDLSVLREVTRHQRLQAEGAGKALRRMRDSARY